MSSLITCGRCERDISEREINSARMTANGYRCLACYQRGKSNSRWKSGDGQELPKHLRMANPRDRWA